jgi:hypothetical protein
MPSSGLSTAEIRKHRQGISRLTITSKFRLDCATRAGFPRFVPDACLVGVAAEKVTVGALRGVSTRGMTVPSPLSRRDPRWFASSSKRTPSQAASRQTRDRISAAFSPIPPVKTTIVITAKPDEPAIDRRDAEVFNRTLFTRDDQVLQQLNAEGEGLTDRQIALLKQWIDAGAKVPAEEKPDPDPREHWAFQKPKRPAIPVQALPSGDCGMGTNTLADGLLIGCQTYCHAKGC